MINRVVLVGRLTKDPVLRKTPNGASVTSFTVACDRRVKTEGQPTADFINVVVWNRVAEIVAQYTHKGSLVGVEGRISTRNYEDQTGKRVYVTEVVADSVQFLEPKSANSGSNYGMNSSYDGGFAQTNSFNPNPGFNQSANGFYQGGEPQASFQQAYEPQASFQQSYQPNQSSSSQTEASSNTLDIAMDDLPF